MDCRRDDGDRAVRATRSVTNIVFPKALQDELKRKERIQRALQELDKTDKKVVHPCEPDARYMKNRRSTEPSYNAQAVADQKSGMIVAEEVVDEGNDNGHLVPMLDEFRRI